MLKASTQNSSDPFFRRVLEMWPYLLIAISVGGFAYIALNNVR
jgi:hypothetical protein